MSTSKPFAWYVEETDSILRNSYFSVTFDPASVTENHRPLYRDTFTQFPATHGITYATVRDGFDGELHIECRFRNGEKYAAVKVDSDKEDLAHWIANALSAEHEALKAAAAEDAKSPFDKYVEAGTAYMEAAKSHFGPNSPFYAEAHNLLSHHIKWCTTHTPIHPPNWVQRNFVQDEIDAKRYRRVKDEYDEMKTSSAETFYHLLNLEQTGNWNLDVAIDKLMEK